MADRSSVSSTHTGRAEQSARLLEMKRLGGGGAQQTRSKPTTRFYRRIQRMKTENLDYLSAAKRAGKRVFGFGAPVKAIRC